MPHSDPASGEARGADGRDICGACRARRPLGRPSARILGLLLGLIALGGVAWLASRPSSRQGVPKDGAKAIPEQSVQTPTAATSETDALLGDVVPPGSALPELPAGPSEDPAVVKAQLDKALADLGSEDADTLYAAVAVVARRKALAAVPKLVQILGAQRDSLNRQAAATALGELRACDGVPALAEALRDRSGMVAQQANKSLRLITDHDLGLSPQSRPQERRRASQDMLEWWGRHEAEVRERLKQPK